MDFRLLRPVLRKLALRLDARVPPGLCELWKLLFRHASAKLKASNLSLCSFCGGLRYLGGGIVSPGWYTSWFDSFVDVVESESPRVLVLKRLFAFSRNGISNVYPLQFTIATVCRSWFGGTCILDSALAVRVCTRCPCLTIRR